MLEEPLTPDQRVFGNLHSLEKMIAEIEDLNTVREQIAYLLEQAISWEGQLISVDDSTEQNSVSVASDASCASAGTAPP
jgi:hypothetical protein